MPGAGLGYHGPFDVVFWLYLWSKNQCTIRNEDYGGGNGGYYQYPRVQGIYQENRLDAFAG